MFFGDRTGRVLKLSPFALTLERINIWLPGLLNAFKIFPGPLNVH